MPEKILMWFWFFGSFVEFFMIQDFIKVCLVFKWDWFKAYVNLVTIQWRGINRWNNAWRVGLVMSLSFLSICRSYRFSWTELILILLRRSFWALVFLTGTACRSGSIAITGWCLWRVDTLRLFTRQMLHWFPIGMTRLLVRAMCITVQGNIVARGSLISCQILVEKL